MATTGNLNRAMLPTDDEMAVNLLAWWALANRDKESLSFNFNWYVFANMECGYMASEYNLSLHTVCQVVSCLSPGKNWKVNLRDARWSIEAHSYSTEELERMEYLRQRGFGVGYTWENTRNAWSALDGNDIPATREKTYNFAHNLEFPEESSFEFATVDQHMIHILCNTKCKGSINPSRYYNKLKLVIIRVAKGLGILPQQLQAAVWGYRVDAFASGLSVDSVYELMEA